MWIFNIIMIMTIISTGFLVGITPLISRQSTPFGVSLPSQYVQDDKIKQYSKQYAYSMIGLSILVALPLVGIPFFIQNEKQLEFFLAIYCTIVILLQLIASFFLYIKYRRNILKWKKTLPAEAFAIKSKIVVDTEYHEKLTTITFKTFFLSQIAIIIVPLILAILYFDHIPEQIPINWGINMEVNRYVSKSWASVLALPGLQLLIIPVLQYAYYSFIKSRQKLSPVSPQLSSEKSRLFREAWSRYFFIIAILTQLLISILFLYSMFIQEGYFGWIIAFIILFLVITIGASLYLSVRYGQAGEKLKLPGDSTNDIQPYYDNEDDSHWLAGIIYYNPDDAAVFVEKRYGIGSTLNMARWQAWLAVVGLIVFILLSLVLSLNLS